MFTCMCWHELACSGNLFSLHLMMQLVSCIYFSAFGVMCLDCISHLNLCVQPRPGFSSTRQAQGMIMLLTYAGKIQMLLFNQQRCMQLVKDQSPHGWQTVRRCLRLSYPEAIFEELNSQSVIGCSTSSLSYVAPSASTKMYISGYPAC